MNSTSLNSNLPEQQCHINSVGVLNALDPNKLYHEWHTWEKDAAPGEDRQKAVKEMIDCLERNAAILDLSGLSLRELPASLPPCDELFLQKNHLTELPPLSDKIKRVDVSHNELSKLPESKPYSLVNFNAGHNCLTELSENWPQGMEWLCLKGNKITSLPASVCKLPNMNCLNLNDNKVVSLPPEIIELPNFAKLFLESNPLSDQSKQILLHLTEDVNMGGRHFIFDSMLQLGPVK